MPLDPEFLDDLACPFCRAPVAQESEDRLRCTGCGRRFPVLNGIPAMRLEDAIEPDDAPAPTPPASPTA